MSNKERLFRAFNNEPVDRIPVGFWFHFLQSKDFSAAVDHPALVEKNIEGHRNYIDACHPDFVKIMSDGFFHYPIGKREEYLSVSDLKKIQVIEADHPWISAQAELVQSVSSIQTDTAYFYNVFSPVSSLLGVLGAEDFFVFLKQDPAVVSEALHTIAKGLVVLTKQVSERGADGVYFSVSNPNTKMISTETYATYIAPSEVFYLREAEKLSENNILHICGYDGKRNVLSAYREYPAKAINWAVHVESVGLAEGKMLFGGKAVIGGFANTPGSLIHTGSKEEISAYVHNIIQEAGKTGVIIGADCTVPADIAYERLNWIRQAVADMSV
ncbi:MAG: hypothetical protein FWH28_01065 [Clostridiales bacterium]|nr:hypothetical protein [Clostridiales bacterium]